ncbi:MAG: endonuclease/exonuclease/phosphatase family protein [Alphaproteobacteria bacterium]|nr:endonuclease/exonuclease/phosphatase family protein [Alphaproteobacteria bacterium]
MVQNRSWAERVRAGINAIRPQKAENATLSVATYNAYNLNPDTGTPDPIDEDRLDKLANSVVIDLQCPDIICLQEIQDESGPKDDGKTSGDKTLEELVSAISNQGGVKYKYAEIIPENNVDGGQPGANIRQAYLYNPEKTELYREEDKAKGKADEGVSVVSDDNGVHLSNSIGRIHPELDCFDDSRKPLIAEFVDKASGESIFVTNVHLISKRGDKEERDGIRAVQATAINEFQVELHNALTDKGLDSNLVIAGDFNSTPDEAPYKLFTSNEFMEGIVDPKNKDNYTYIHRGEKSILDNVIVSSDMAEKAQGKTVNVNAHKPYKSDRASDHNPVIANGLATRDQPQAQSSGFGR